MVSHSERQNSSVTAVEPQISHITQLFHASIINNDNEVVSSVARYFETTDKSLRSYMDAQLFYPYAMIHQVNVSRPIQ
jgi:hypothetical protein